MRKTSETPLAFSSGMSSSGTMPLATEDCTGTNCADRKRWTWTDYEQDNTALSYILNPRVKESRVGDTVNVKKTAVTYRLIPNTTVAEYGLVSKVEVFDTGLSNVIKRVETDYLLTKPYTDRRILGLPSETRAWGKNDTTQNLEQVSRVTYGYDEGTFSQEPNQIIAPTRHDTTNYGSAFTKRGNPTSTTRWEVPNNVTSVTSQVRYDIAGSPVAQIDPLNRKVRVGYSDNFDTTGNPTTFAYPTVVTDPAGTILGDSLHSSTVKYRYDIGANVEAVSPAPAGNTLGKKTTRLFDSVGRIQQETIVNSGAYTRYEYPSNGVQSKVFSTIIDTNDNGADALDEVMSESWSDGAGRVRRSRTEHPGSIGGWSASVVEYDILGRANRQSVPTEVSVPNANDPDTWSPAGDDATRGWLWTYQKYDWKGRVVRKINTDGTDSPTLNDSDVLITYDGCGCAGGQITTIKSENVPVPNANYPGNPPTTSGRRTQKIYADILGRNYKTEMMNWDGVSPYTTIETFNGRDQVVIKKETDNTSTANPQTHQEVTTSYDGHGRIKTQHKPVENAQTDTTWVYNADDSIQQVIDPRGVITTFGYNSRALVDNITYSVPSGSNILLTSNTSISYDNMGNRTQMTDGSGTKTYSYDQLSRLTSETKVFAGLSGSFPLNYTYHLTDELKSITDPFGAITSYSFDKVGRTAGLSGSGPLSLSQYISSVGYRAWGTPKQTTYGNGRLLNVSYNNRLQVSRIDMPSAGSANYSYYADGKVRYLENDTEWPTDIWGQQADRSRSFRYDHIGRLQKALTASSARDEGNNLPIGSTPFHSGPFTKYLGYDAFSNMTGHSGDYWLFSDYSYTTTYVNSRNQDSTLQFDALGNILVSGSRGFSYDAAGELVWQYWPSTLYLTYDGDGNLTKTNHLQFEPTPTITYFLTSTVLGGEAVAELNQSGQKKTGNVYAEGGLIAKQTTGSDGTYLMHSDPMNTIRWSTTSGGVASYGADIDPVGVSIDATPDPTGFAPQNWFPLYVGSSWDSETGRCTVDGATTRCSLVEGMLNTGTGVQCPNNQCGPIRVNGEWKFFSEHADGYGSYESIGHKKPKKGPNPHLFNRFARFFNGKSLNSRSDPGDPCTITSADGTTVQGTTDEHGVCNPSIGTFDAGTSYDVPDSNLIVSHRPFRRSNSYGSWMDEGRLVTAPGNQFTVPLQVAGVVNSFCGTALGHPQNSRTFWRGPDGKFYKGPFSITKAVRGVNTAAFGIGTALSAAQMINGDVHPLKGMADIGMGYVGAYGGPYGWLTAGGYFVYNAIPNAPPPSQLPVSTNQCHGESREYNPRQR